MKEILQLKNDFNCVKVLRGDILNVFETLDSKLMVLKKIYINLLGLHNQSEHMFGIDSFYFQNKLIENEFENLKDIQHYIENRMYCEYYQLHILVQEYVEKEVVSENVRNKIAVRKKYPAYKNLDPRRIYDFRLVAELQDHIIISIMELETYRQAKVAELETDNAQSKLGLNIGNLVNSHRFYNALLKEKISMFVRYLQVFHEHHTKYFTRLHIKAKLIMGIINEDIQIKQFNPTGSSSNAFPHTDMDSPLSGVSHKPVKSEEQTIKSFVKYEDSRDDLKAALDTIVSNIPNEKVESHSIRALANNTPTDFIGGDDDEDVKLDIESDISSEIQSESQDSNANESIMTEYDEGNCAFTEFDVGKRVLVEGYDSIGTLRFVGKHNVKNVTRCGVEFDEEIGKNNGTIDGHIYFEAMDNRGVLVSPRKVSFVDI
tara:strand:- start:999 stop:2291 length:1293 start_codon:yes stop_codon:yes gene_type:complete